MADVKPQWPKTVPVLTADDICRGQYATTTTVGKTRRHQHCAAGWLAEVFGQERSGYPSCINEARYRAYREARKVLAQVIKHDYGDIEGWNDGLTSKKAIADAINKTFARLGYTEDA